MNLGKLKHVVSYSIKNILKLSSHIEMGTIKYKTQNQVLIFCMINALKILKLPYALTSHTRLLYHKCNSIYLISSKKTLAVSSKKLKDPYEN